MPFHYGATQMMYATRSDFTYLIDVSLVLHSRGLERGHAICSFASSIFDFLFVVLGYINQLQPLFISNRDISEIREKKSKTYSWIAFVSAQLLSEISILIVCDTI